VSSVSFGPLKPGKITISAPVAVAGLTASRRIRVYVPRGHDFSRPACVLYMLDGQNVFDDAPSFVGGWHLHEVVERCTSQARPGRSFPVLVGIDHGNQHRLDELSPFAAERSAGQADLLLSWIVGSVMPALRSRLSIVEGAAGAAIGGSSMGGLCALYAHFRFPESFGGVVCMSPSLFFAGQRIFGYLAERPRPLLSRIYLDCGAREGQGTMFSLAERMANELRGRGYDHDALMWRPDQRGTHNEKSWRRRAPKALRFIYR
jgi:predicted alpha/beta superfamily hydrolase